MDINELASSTDGYTGADLAGLVRQASLYALKEIISLTEATSQINVSKSNFIDALKNTKSSISEQVNKIVEWISNVGAIVLCLSYTVFFIGQTPLREVADDLCCDTRLVPVI